MEPPHTEWHGEPERLVFAWRWERNAGLLMRMVLGQVLMLAALGIAIGIPAALGTSRLVQSFLFGIKANDPLAMSSAMGILLGAVILAGYVPARKASRIDPITALRNE